jgi:hypothetical protein
MNDTMPKLGLQCLEDFGAKIHILSNTEGFAFDETEYASLTNDWSVELQAEEMDAAISTFEGLIVQLTAGFIPQDLVEDVAERVSSSTQRRPRTGIDDRKMPPLWDSRNRIGQPLEDMPNRELKHVATTASERVPRTQPNREVNDEWDIPEKTTVNWQASHFSPKRKARTQLPGISDRKPKLGQEFKTLGGLEEMGRLEQSYKGEQDDDQEIALWRKPLFAGATPEQQVQGEAGASGFSEAPLQSPEVDESAHKSRKHRNEWPTHQEMNLGQGTGPSTPEKGRESINLNEIMEELKEKLQNDFERHYGDQSWQ